LLETLFMLLDEPTANLDPVAERAVMRVVRTASRTQAILLVTHRLVELDWLDELLGLGRGPYRRTWSARRSAPLRRRL
jgi:ABC-type transport system involved in cytochrome bd biosynthesis fused ATPase/permease subunit